MTKKIILLAPFAILAGLFAASADDKPQPIGYSDTPLIPGTKWKVHDIDRPRPAAVAPGARLGDAPADAIVIFDGKDTRQLYSRRKGDATGKHPSPWKIENGELIVDGGDCWTHLEFASCQLHLEWKSEPHTKGNSQKKGNGGVFFMDRYESQMLDCDNNPTYADGMAGGGQTANNFESTPDGREGWATNFLRAGFAVYLVDQPGRALTVDLAPQPGDVNVDDVVERRRARRFLPHVSRQCLARHHLTLIAEQELEEFKLPHRQFNRLAGPRHLPGNEVHRQVPDRKLRGFSFPTTATNSPNPGQQLGKRKRLDQIIVSTQFQTPHTILHIIARRQQKHRQENVLQ